MGKTRKYIDDPRETEEWWWGGSSSRFDRVSEKDPEDDNIFEPDNY